MKILNAITELLKFQGSATISEIARIAEVKQREVLSVLNDNLIFLKKDDKNRSKIVRLTDYFSDQFSYYMRDPNYRFYKYGDYYGDVTVSCYHPLFQPFVVTGYYDPGYITEEKQKFLDENGFQDIKNARYYTLSEMWKEGDNVVGAINSRSLCGNLIKKNLS